MVTENDLGMPSIPRSSACGMLTRLSEQLSKEKRAVAVHQTGEACVGRYPLGSV